MNLASKLLTFTSATALACLLSVSIADAAQKSKPGMPQDSGMQQQDSSPNRCSFEESRLQ